MPSEGPAMALCAALAAPANVNINVRPVIDAVQDPQLACQQQITKITQALPQLVLEANQLIPLHRMPSAQFLEPLNDEQQVLGPGRYLCSFYCYCFVQAMYPLFH